jgi:RNA polymerase sigma factor (sigma-70 family)
VGPKSFFGRERSDASLISESLHQSEAFEAIFDRHFDAVHAYLARRAGVVRADDLSSTTFVVAFERRETFYSPAGTARPWLFGIATNVLRNELRTEQRAVGALTRLAADETRGVVEATLPEAGVVCEMLAALDRDQRDALLLFAWEGLSYEEIALALGAPVGTIRSRLARARARLRVLLETERSGVAPSPDRQEMTE